MNHRTSNVGLLRPPEIALRNEDVSHGQHAETTQFLSTSEYGTSSSCNKATNLGGIEHDRWKTRRHFTVQSDLDTSLDLVLCLDQRIK
jgi:hypothetical protein